MALLRQAATTTTRIPLGDEGDWIDVRDEIAKADFNRFIKYLPGREIDEKSKLSPAEATELQKGMFEALVVAWSSDLPCGVDGYLTLGTEGANAVDAALAEHFKKLTPTKEEEKAGFRPS